MNGAKMKINSGYYSEKIRNAAYVEMLDKLNAMQKKVYYIIKEHGPLSNEEIAKILSCYPHAISPRVYELRDKELVLFAGIGQSPVSGINVSLWKVAPVDNQLKLF